MSPVKGSYTRAELLALDRNEAFVYRGRVVPIMRGADEPPVVVVPPVVDPPVGDPADKTFTQAELDKIVQDRVARAKATPPADYDDLKTKAAEFDKIQAASKTELEKATEARVKAEGEGKAAIERANARLIQAEVLAAATTAKAIKPEHLHKLIDLNGVTVGDDGQVTGVEDAVKTFLEANPEYVGTGTTTNGSADQGARDGGGAKQLTSVEGMSAEEIAKAVTDGRLDTYLKTPN